MEEILRTDNAWQAIDKINANFSQAATAGGKSLNDYVTGNGDESVFYQFDAQAGDYFRISFPEGDWPTKSQRSNFNKFFFGCVNSSGTKIWLINICRETWEVPGYGYDLYIPDDIPDVAQGYVAFRASSGARVPFVIQWLDKTEMKPYFLDEMSDTVAKVRARQGDSTVTLAICTDLHYRNTTESYRPFAPFNAIAMGLTMRELGKRVRVDNLLCMGDIIQGAQTAAIAKRDADDMQRSFARAEIPILNTIGNHDDNRYWSREDGDRRLNKKEIHAYFVEYNDWRSSVGGAEQECNFYRDIDRNKIRIISLLSTNLAGDYLFTAATRTWLTDTFASMPEGYKAVIFTHTPLDGTKAWEGGNFPGGSSVETIIQNNLDKFIAIFYGHTHFDNVWMSPFPEVNLGCAKCYNLEGGIMSSEAPEWAYHAEREAGDYREVLYDVVVINQTEELMSCIRFGAGLDRYIHYVPVDVEAGGTTTLTPAIITATEWDVRSADSSSISISSGDVTIAAGATIGSKLMAVARDAEGNMEVWAINVTE